MDADCSSSKQLEFETFVVGIAKRTTDGDGRCDLPNSRLQACIPVIVRRATLVSCWSLARRDEYRPVVLSLSSQKLDFDVRESSPTNE
jgi:hypothetical protein